MTLMTKSVSLIFITCLLLAATTLTRAEPVPYQTQGMVTKVVAAGKIIVLNQQYELDNDTQVHDRMRLGEVGPNIQTGDEIGFNYELKGDSLYITDIWPISFKQR